jgi:hypothetical protein
MVKVIIVGDGDMWKTSLKSILNTMGGKFHPTNTLYGDEKKNFIKILLWISCG